jgi:hypothetical protein
MSYITNINTTKCTIPKIYFNSEQWGLQPKFAINVANEQCKKLGGFRPKNITMEELIPFCPFNLQVR